MPDYNFTGSFSVKVCNQRTAYELSPAEEHGGREGEYRVRVGRRWVNCPDGSPRFFNRESLALLIAESALGQVTAPDKKPKMHDKQRVSVHIDDDRMPLGGWTTTEPILAYDGQWKIGVMTSEGSRFVDCDDVKIIKK